MCAIFVRLQIAESCRFSFVASGINRLTKNRQHPRRYTIHCHQQKLWNDLEVIGDDDENKIWSKFCGVSQRDGRINIIRYSFDVYRVDRDDVYSQKKWMQYSICTMKLLQTYLSEWCYSLKSSDTYFKTHGFSLRISDIFGDTLSHTRRSSSQIFRCNFSSQSSCKKRFTKF